MLGYSPTLSCQQEFFGGVAASSAGTTITGGAAAKGSWVTLGTAVYDWDLFVVTITNNNNTVFYTLDIGVEESGAAWVAAADLVFDGRLGNNRGATSYLVPVHIPAGGIIRARAACSGAAARTCQVTINGSSASLMGTPGFNKMVPLFGLTSALPTAAYDPGASANTKGAWANDFTAPGRIGAISCAFGCGGDTSRTGTFTWLCDVGIKTGSEYTIVMGNMAIIALASSYMLAPPSLGPIACDIPAGETISVRAQCSSAAAGDRLIDVLPYGFLV